MPQEARKLHCHARHAELQGGAWDPTGSLTRNPTQQQVHGPALILTPAHGSTWRAGHHLHRSVGCGVRWEWGPRVEQRQRWSGHCCVVRLRHFQPWVAQEGRVDGVGPSSRHPSPPSHFVHHLHRRRHHICGEWSQRTTAVERPLETCNGWTNEKCSITSLHLEALGRNALLLAKFIVRSEQ
jgi:hypothetical protein